MPGKGRPFPKGVSGSPGGKPKDGTIRAMARAHGPAAIEALALGLTDPKNYITAAIALLDRGYGKPKQEIDATVTNIAGGIDAPIAPEDIEAWLAKRAKQRADAQKLN